MGKSPGKWIKAKIFGKKSSKSSLSKDATLDRKTSITSKAQSKDYDNDSMVISSPVPPVIHVNEEHTELQKTSSVNLTSDTIEVERNTTTQNTAIEDESINLEQAAIKAQTAFRGYLARREYSALKAIILLQAHIRGYLVRKQIQPQTAVSNLEGKSVISTETEKPNPNLKEMSTYQPEQSYSELEKVKQSLRKISVSNAMVSEPKPEPESEPEPEPEPKTPLDEDKQHDGMQDVNDDVNGESEVVMNGKENVKTKRRKSFPAKQEHVESVVQSSPVLPSYMAATESAKAKLRAQAAAKAAEDGGENGFVRRHSLPSSTGKMSLQSPRVQKPLQANGKGWSKSNKAQVGAREDKIAQSGWKR